MADEVIYLEEGDLALVEAKDIFIFDKHMDVVNRPRTRIEHSNEEVSKEGHDHFMHKEIHEQTVAVQRTLDGLNQLSLSATPEMDFADIDRLSIIACGTSYYAAMVA